MVPVIFLLGLAMYAVVPVTAFAGLRRCIRARSERNWIFLPSFIGFGFGLASALLVFIAIAWGGGSYRYYDPDLLRFFKIGMLLSLAGVMAGLGGIWKKNLLRWHAPLLSLGMLMLLVDWA